jgi:hypothetical protein
MDVRNKIQVQIVFQESVQSIRYFEEVIEAMVVGVVLASWAMYAS